MRLLHSVYLIVSLAVLFLPLNLTAEKDEDFEKIVSEICNSGIDKPTAELVAEAFTKASSSGNITPFVDLLNSNQHAGRIAMITLGATEEGRRLLIYALEKHKINNPEYVIYALGFAEEKESVDFLVKYLATQTDESVREAVLFVLRIICRQDIDNNAEWSKWWAENRDSFKFAEDPDFEERGKAMQAEIQRKCKNQISDMITDMSVNVDKNSKAAVAVDAMGSMVESISEIMDAADNAEYSEETKTAVRYFRSGDHDAAEKYFNKALKNNPNELYSQYLLGSVLIEAGKLKEAEDVFDRICLHEKNHMMASFLRRYCRHRLTDPEEDILNLLIFLIDNTEFYDKSMWGWNDEVVPDILGQLDGRDGLYYYDQKKLTKLLDENKNSPEMVIGVSLMRSYDNRIPTLEAYDKTFAESPLYQSAILHAYISSYQDKYINRIVKKAKLLQKLEPDNGFFYFIDAYYSNSENTKKHSGKYQYTPLEDDALSMINKTIESPGFNSYASEIIGSPILVAQKSGEEFAEMVGWGKSMSALMHNPLFLTAAKRLRKNIEEEIAAGETEAAISHADLILKLGKRLHADNNLVLNALIAFSIEGMGYNLLTNIYEKADMEKDLKQIKCDFAKTKRQKEKISGRISTISPIAVIPVPEIQKAVISAIVEDEFGFTQRLPKK